MIKRWFYVVTFIVGCSVCAGCSFIERKGVDSATPLLADAVDNLLGFKNAQVAHEGLPGNALLISALCEFSPQNDRLLALASMAYCAYGLTFEGDLLNPEDKPYVMELYEIGSDYGLRALQVRNKAIRQGLEQGKHFMDLAKNIKKGDVPSAFWYSMNSGLRIMLDMDKPEMLIGLGDVLALMDKIIALDDSYFFYAPHLFQGAYSILAGPMLGGGTEKAKKEFEAAFQSTNNKFLLAHVFYVRFFATTIVDEKLFDSTLNYVLKTPASVYPEAQLANDIAKRKAVWLMNNKDKFF